MATAGTLAISDQSPLRGPLSPVRKLTFAWTSDSSGNAAGWFASALIPQTVPIAGRLVRVVFVPGTPAPVNGHTVSLIGADGIDVLAGQGQGLSGAANSAICPGVKETNGAGQVGVVPVTIADDLQLIVGGAGAGAQGMIVIYVR